MIHFRSFGYVPPFPMPPFGSGAHNIKEDTGFQYTWERRGLQHKYQKHTGMKSPRTQVLYVTRILQFWYLKIDHNIWTVPHLLRQRRKNYADA